MKTIQLPFGVFVELADDKVTDRTAFGTERTRPVVNARARATDSSCVGSNEADALNGLAEVYEHMASQLRHEARLASRTWRVSFRKVPTKRNSVQRIDVIAASKEEAQDKVTGSLAYSVLVESVEFIGGAS